jgi:hypothetical protein
VGNISTIVAGVGPENGAYITAKINCTTRTIRNPPSDMSTNNGYVRTANPIEEATTKGLLPSRSDNAPVTGMSVMRSTN